jgi:ribonuclease HII
VAKPDFSREGRLIRAGLGFVAGVDEVGRGALAGPVAAAAVILDPDNLPDGIDDSKALNARRRAEICAAIMAKARAIAIATSTAGEIDALNIRGATLLAMRRAIGGLAILPGFVLIDGRDLPPGLCCPAEAVVGGDALSVSIAAASIVAKVTRDAMMARLDAQYPDYGFARHAGYGTARHLSALKRFGPTPLHRLSFAPCAAAR